MMGSSSETYLLIFLEGGFLAVFVFVVLMIMSIWSWTVIFQKGIYFYNTQKRSRSYFSSLKLNKGLQDLKARSEIFADAYLARVFNNAYLELSANTSGGEIVYNPEVLSRIERNIERTISLQNQRMERGLTLLATISGSAPFIGLFGTVVGIIDAFFNIGSQGAASIAVVAPGISTALVATAFGLFTAIPALIAFNLFRSSARRIANDMRSYGLEIINLFSRGG
ncbi:MAG: MotA/TolQ/ExbB proton channel family protein [Deltaproteobacteria bacterium]|nr:MotA/TolQ/ExbB proton channel family protein [Deltaproteobacteria bacterium]